MILCFCFTFRCFGTSRGIFVDNDSDAVSCVGGEFS